MITTPHWTSALAAAALLVGLAACGGGGGSSGSGGATTPPASGAALHDTVSYSSAPTASLASATEAAAVTHQSLALANATVAYTAAAGHLTALAPSTGQAEASMFYVAYTVDTPGAARPLIFFHNGGPGSASVWLHLGSFAPRRVVTNIPQTTIPTPFELTDNADSLIDAADLVFVDAVGTGYSEAVAPNTNQSFWSVDGDAALMRDFIARYVAVNGRSASPTYIFGESYGTTRNAVLANLMVTAGMRLDGVVLLSSILDYNSNCAMFDAGTVSCAGYVPTYGLTGAWFSLTQPAAPAADSYAQQMRSFSSASYAPAVTQFLASGTVPAPSLIASLVDLTGAPAALWDAGFDLGPDTYRSQVLPSQLMGRYDARVIAPVGSPLAAGGDPSSTLINAPFTAAIAARLANELLYTAPTPYAMSSDAVNTWNFSHDGRSLPDTIPDLAAALLQNTKLRVLSLGGYEDMATPFYQTELDLARLTAPPLTEALYTSGHMAYLDNAARPLMKTAIVGFLQGGSAP